MRFIKLNYATGGLDGVSSVCLNVEKIGFIEETKINGQIKSYVKYDGQGGFDVMESIEEILKLIEKSKII